MYALPRTFESVAEMVARMDLAPGQQPAAESTPTALE
jgi:hypothetical protein